MTLQQKMKQIRDGLAGLSVPAYHYWRPKLVAPYVVWQENGEGDSLQTDNRKTEQVISGTLDLFSKTEFDPVADEIQAILSELEIAWSLESVQYESETNMIHHEWSWEVSCGDISV